MDFTAAVIGTGFIGPIHVRALQRAGVHVAGILGSSPEKSGAAAESLGLQRGYRSFDQVLSDPNIDSVHITTPNRLHFEQATAALDAGKHVFCEKPLAMRSDQTALLARLAREKNLAGGVAYNVRYYPLCHHAAEMFATGECGQFIHAHGSYTQDWLLKRTDFNWRVLSQDGGELRAMADIGTHWMDLIQFIVGQKIVSVCADLRTVHDERERPTGNLDTFSTGGSENLATETTKIDTEDCGSVMLRFANKASGCLWVSQCTAGRKNCIRYEIGGTQKSLRWDSESCDRLIIGHRDQANELLLRDPSLMHDSAAAVSVYPGGHNEGYSDTFKQLFRSFYGSITSGEHWSAPRFPTFDDGHYEIEICEAILKSHRERRWVEIGNSQGDNQQ